MAYLSDWELLSHALSRVMATGVSRNQAKRDLCDAIIDRKIRVRHLDDEVRIPQDLDPEYFDWKNSRSRYTWQRVRENSVFGLWRPSRIELNRADVTSVLCGGKPGKTGLEEATTGTAREAAATQALAAYLSSIPKDRRANVKRADAESWCRAQGFLFSKRRFQNRIWPQARESAGLSPLAGSGRKRKPLR